MDDVRDLLRPLLMRRLSPAERRAIAVALRQIADEQERLADAERDDARRPAPARLRPSGGKGGRPGSMAVYLEVRPDRRRAEPAYVLRIGRGIYDAYQRLRPDPRADLRLTVQIVGRQLLLSEDASGYLVTVNDGGVRVNVSGSRDHLGSLTPGQRYVASARAGAIVAELS